MINTSTFLYPLNATYIIGNMIRKLSL